MSTEMFHWSHARWLAQGWKLADFEHSFRHTDGGLMPSLDPAECAAHLNVSVDFIRDEIARGKLPARRYESTEGRIRYRVERADWESYLATHWPKTVANSPQAGT